MAKKSVTYTLDEEVIASLNMYVEELKRQLPESMRETTKMHSGAVNDILKTFLTEKKYLTELQGPQQQ
jgi:cell wall assembly regulator SMI1